MLKVGFHRAALRRFTGFKSSGYTEGALFYGERPFVAGMARDIEAQAGKVAEPKAGECAPSSA